MFCYQCQEASKGIGCTIIGVCGKNENVAKLLDFLVFTTKKISKLIVEKNISSKDIDDINENILKSLFMSITNANFDEEAIVKQIKKNFSIKGELQGSCNCNCTNMTKEEILKKAEEIGVLSEENEDIRSLKELIVYGIKGMAAYISHAKNLNKQDYSIYDFIYKTISRISNEDVTLGKLIELSMKVGEFGVKSMALLDEANTISYGNPEITEINIGTRNRPAILISGHDLSDLEQLLEQTKGSGVDVYTHSEMLPAHFYPKFKEYDNLYGNYGNAWHKQLEEFKTFNGPIVFTTNCIVPPRDEEIKNRIFTLGASGYSGCKHLYKDENGKIDFSEVIEMAKKCSSPTEIENGKIVGGFAHHQVISLIDKVVENIKNGSIKEFVVMAGCDGRMKSREYYTNLAKSLPKESIILTAGCAKYRYNKLELGNVNGIPRVLDAGQCNDSYSLVKIALTLKEELGLDDINDLPIKYDIAWYEQKAVIVLLSLLYLGVKNIKLGLTLPAFLSPNIKNFLVENFNISTI